MESLYKDINGYTIPESDEKTIVSHGGDSTYGEITYDGCRKLAGVLKLGSRDKFYDLGCGTGGCVVQIYLTTPVKKSVGIEYAKSRYDLALSVKKQLRTKGLMRAKRTLQFIHGDILHENFNDATAILFNSLCFKDAFMNKMVDRFARLKTGTRIASTKELPTRQYLVNNGSQPIKMSWDPEAIVYFYTIRHPNLVAAHSRA